MDNFISVIVPVYNTENFIEKCVNSILHQTYTNFEVILVDDGSTDSSGIMCDNFLNQDARINVIHQNNSGSSKARERGLLASSGDIISFIDSDDWIEPTFLERLLSPMLNDASIDIVSGCYQKTTVDGTILKTVVDNTIDIKYLTPTEALIDMCTNNARGGSLCMNIYRKYLFNNLVFSNNLIFDEDFASNWILYSRAKKICYLRTHDYHYVVNLKSLSHICLIDECEKAFQWKIATLNNDQSIIDTSLKKALAQQIIKSYDHIFHEIIVQFPKKKDDLLRLYDTYHTELSQVFNVLPPSYVFKTKCHLYTNPQKTTCDLLIDLIYKLKDWVQHGGIIYIYGAGKIAKQVELMLNNNNIRFAMFIISNGEPKNESFNNTHPIIYFNEFLRQNSSSLHKISLIVAMRLDFAESVLDVLSKFKFGSLFII